MPLVIPYPKNIKEKIPGVYAIEHKSSGKSYIGSTGDLGSRGLSNKSSLRLGKHKNKPLQEAYIQDPNIELKVLAVCIDREEAYAKEQKFIDQGLISDSIFNIATNAKASHTGRAPSNEQINRFAEYARNRVDSPETTERKSKSHLGKKLTEEHKAKISAFVNSPDFIAKIKLANTGRVMSDETKQKISTASTGRITSEATKQKQKEIQKDKAKSVNVKGTTYPSIKAAARELNINPGSLSSKISSGKFKDFSYA